MGGKKADLIARLSAGRRVNRRKRISERTVGCSLRVMFMSDATEPTYEAPLPDDVYSTVEKASSGPPLD